MTTWVRKVSVIVAFSFFQATAAHAIPFTVAFTATDFVSLVGSSPAPDDAVSGAMIYDAASINSPIDSLTAISLTISGHTYTLAEVGFLDLGLGFEEIGGLIDGVNGSGNSETDFSIIWDTSSLMPLLFLYATSDSSGIWDTSTFTQFSVTPSAVPEPNTLALLALGFLGNAWAMAVFVRTPNLSLNRTARRWRLRAVRSRPVSLVSLGGTNRLSSAIRP
jgi:hypothetical protein